LWESVELKVKVWVEGKQQAVHSGGVGRRNWRKGVMARQRKVYSVGYVT
jgi:hypothetical protein